MVATNYLKETPWDQRTFKIDTYEVVSDGKEALKETDNRSGHYTLKTDPFSPKGVVEDYGFYYVDTLLEVECKEGDLKEFENEGITIKKEGELEPIKQIAKEVFVHGRFHRDHNVPSTLANIRYARWLEDLYHQNQVYHLYYEGQLAGFIGYEGNKILLLGMEKEFRGRGFSKTFLYTVCSQLFSEGHDKLVTSISAINQPSLNLFYSMGFRVKGSVDVYHKLNGTIDTE